MSIVDDLQHSLDYLQQLEREVDDLDKQQQTLAAHYDAGEIDDLEYLDAAHSIAVRLVEIGEEAQGQ